MTSRALNGVGVTWAYDGLGRLTSEVAPLGIFSYTFHGETSRLASSTYPNGQTSLYSYLGNSADRRLQTIHHKLSGGATLSKFDHTYDVVGNILTWQQQADTDNPTKWEYGYDAADQLSAAVKKTTATPATVLAQYGYRYDAGGNRTAEQIGDVVTGATHDALNRLLTHTAAGALRIAGELKNRLVAVNIGTHRSEFTYDGLDRRVRIVERESGATTRDAELFWDGADIIEERLSIGEVNRFFADGESHNGTARYVTRDHLNSVREVTDSAAVIAFCTVRS